MKSYRCTICGEVYIGSRIPSDCPFCGVRSRYIEEADKVNSEELFTIKDITDESIKNLLTALNMEVSNASFYKCASEKGEDQKWKAIFNRLARVEREHAETIRKYLGFDKVDFIEEECSEFDEINREGAIEREENALKFYRKASAEAHESKISIFFRALYDVEKAHLEVLGSDKQD